jgi:putative phosphoesterase
MKRILLLSDTHGYLDEPMLKHVREVDEVWHAGDIGSLSVADRLSEIKPLKAVYGNIDDHTIRKEFPLHQRFMCEGVDVWMTHIGGYPGRYSPDIRNEIIKYPPKLFVTGHSHILKVMNDKKLGLLHMNPGAVGTYGFQRTRTMLRFEIDRDEIKELHVIEFERKKV